jgi:signal transduction histidine kinase
MAYILVVEDSPTQAERLVGILEQNAHRMTVVPDAETALAVLERDRHDLVISDVVMPGMSGYELCRRIKARPNGKNIPVMLLTTLNEPMDIIRGLECGADNFITKPYNSAHLVERIDRIVEHQMLRAAGRLQFGIEIVFLGKRFIINSEKEQILDLLISTFEDTVRANLELQSKKQELAEINERLRHEINERQRAEEQLLQARKMEAVGQLTGGIAHDFNNLLTSLLGNLDLALRRNLDDPTRRMIQVAIQSAERGAKLTSHLLAFGRRQTLNVRPLNLNELVTDLKDMLASSVTPAISIELALEPDLSAALGDPRQLELALVNLAINARDAMPSGGTLRIETRNVAAADRPQDVALDASSYVALVVRDSGTGMSEDVKAHAFEPFFTTKEVGKGSGLGLSMVYGLAKQLGGTVEIDSAPGQGTAVTFYLRAAIAAAIEPAKTAAEEIPRAPGDRKTVLVVDDDSNVRDVAANTLRRAGYEVIETDNATAALSVLERQRDISILVTDLVMPGMHGSQLVTEARRRRPMLPIMIITGYPGTEFQTDGADQRFPVLHKPFRPAELATMVAQCQRGQG